MSNPDKFLQQLVAASTETVPEVDVRSKVADTLSRTTRVERDLTSQLFVGAAVATAVVSVSFSSAWQTLLEPWVGYLFL